MAFGVTKNFKRLHVNTGIYFTLPTVDTDKFCKFVLSVIWRASISERPELIDFTLGEFEAVIRDVIFDKVPLADLSEVEIAVQRYTSKITDPTRLFFYPVWANFLGRNTVGFSAGGFRFVSKIDRRPFPGAMRPLILNAGKLFRGLYLKLEDTEEYRGMVGLVAANAKRATSRTAK
jgi:hypothetical protein